MKPTIPFHNAGAENLAITNLISPTIQKASDMYGSADWWGVAWSFLSMGLHQPKRVVFLPNSVGNYLLNNQLGEAVKSALKESCGCAKTIDPPDP